MDQSTNPVPLGRSLKLRNHNISIEVSCAFALLSLCMLYFEGEPWIYPHLLCNAISIASIFVHSILSKRQHGSLQTEIRSAYIRITDHESTYANLEALYVDRETMLNRSLRDERASAAMMRWLASGLRSARDTIKNLNSALAHSTAALDEKEAALDAEHTQNQTLTDTIQYLENISDSTMDEIEELRSTVADLEVSLEEVDAELTTEITNHQASRAAIQQLESRLVSASNSIRITVANLPVTSPVMPARFSLSHGRLSSSQAPVSQSGRFRVQTVSHGQADTVGIWTVDN